MNQQLNEPKDAKEQRNKTNHRLEASKVCKLIT